MAGSLEGKRVAIVVADGFEQVEMTEPKRALEEEGATAAIVSPNEDEVRGWNHTEWGDSFEVDIPIADAAPDDFDALVLPGGVMSPDKLRMTENVLRFVEHFVRAGKPIAAICHGPWTLLEVGALRGKKVTSYPSLRTDLQNAGATWVDEPVVTDMGIVTSRGPQDLSEFCSKMVEEIREGRHEQRTQGEQDLRPGL